MRNRAPPRQTFVSCVLLSLLLLLLLVVWRRGKTTNKDHAWCNKITEDLHVVEQLSPSSLVEQLSPSSFSSTNADHVMVLYNCDIAVSCVAVVGEMLLLSSCVSSGGSIMTKEQGVVDGQWHQHRRTSWFFVLFEWSRRSPNDWHDGLTDLRQ